MDQTEDFNIGNTLFNNNKTLLIDGDIVAYKACCIFNEDKEEDRKRIFQIVRSGVNRLTREADCIGYRIFLTGNSNFRNLLINDYKANRRDVVKPVNLEWIKKEILGKLDGELEMGLEADDLLSINQSNSTVIWSIDKDLRQVVGSHLDDETRKVVAVTELGKLELITKSKIRFEGGLGFYFQCLTGDGVDNILGCAVRKTAMYKTGKKAGLTYKKRFGVGPLAAYNLLKNCNLEQAKTVIGREYYKIYEDDWQEALETQANLLFMVKERIGSFIKRWTYDDREEWYCTKTGDIYEDINRT